MTQTLTREDVIALVNTKCDDFAEYKDAARWFKVTPAVLSQTRLGRLKMIPARIVKRLDLKVVTLYVKQGDTPAKPHRKPTAKAKSAPPSKPAKKPTPAPASKRAAKAMVKAYRQLPAAKTVTEMAKTFQRKPDMKLAKVVLPEGGKAKAQVIIADEIPFSAPDKSDYGRAIPETKLFERIDAEADLDDEAPDLEREAGITIDLHGDD